MFVVSQKNLSWETDNSALFSARRNKIKSKFFQAPYIPSNQHYQHSNKRHSYQRNVVEIQSLGNKTYWAERHWNNCAVWRKGKNGIHVRERQRDKWIHTGSEASFFDVFHTISCILLHTSSRTSFYILFARPFFRTCTLFWVLIFSFTCVFYIVPYLSVRLIFLATSYVLSCLTFFYSLFPFIFLLFPHFFISLSPSFTYSSFYRLAFPIPCSVSSVLYSFVQLLPDAWLRPAASSTGPELHAPCVAAAVTSLWSNIVESWWCSAVIQ